MFRFEYNSVRLMILANLEKELKPLPMYEQNDWRSDEWNSLILTTNRQYFQSFKIRIFLTANEDGSIPCSSCCHFHSTHATMLFRHPKAYSNPLIRWRPLRICRGLEWFLRSIAWWRWCFEFYMNCRCQLNLLNSNPATKYDSKRKKKTSRK